MSGTRFEGIEWRIVDLLREDGRMSNREIARQLGISEGTVRSHLKRLVDQHMLRIRAITDLGAMGMRAAAQVGIFVEQGRAREIADALAVLPGITFVAITFGQYDIIAIVLVETREELLNLLSDQIATIPGVRRTESMEFLRAEKHEFGLSRIR